MKRTPAPLIDDRIYTVIGINGFRRGNLKLDEAFALANRMNEQMNRAGWAGKARVCHDCGTTPKPDRLPPGSPGYEATPQLQ